MALNLRARTPSKQLLTVEHMRPDDVDEKRSGPEYSARRFFATNLEPEVHAFGSDQ